MTREQYLKKLGKRIVELRIEKGLSQTQLAHACGKDPQSIERVENGKINPSIYYLSEIAKALEIPLKEILEIEILRIKTYSNVIPIIISTSPLFFPGL